MLMFNFNKRALFTLSTLILFILVGCSTTPALQPESAQPATEQPSVTHSDEPAAAQTPTLTEAPAADSDDYTAAPSNDPTASPTEASTEPPETADSGDTHAGHNETVVPTPKGTTTATTKSTPKATDKSTENPKPTIKPIIKPTIKPTIKPSAKPTKTSVIEDKEVEIKNFSYSSTPLTIQVGAKVTFTNRDSVKHTATASDGSFDTGLIAKDKSVTIQFDKPGTYEYYCEPHPDMTAVIIVE